MKIFELGGGRLPPMPPLYVRACLSVLHTTDYTRGITSLIAEAPTTDQSEVNPQSEFPSLKDTPFPHIFYNILLCGRIIEHFVRNLNDESVYYSAIDEYTARSANF